MEQIHSESDYLSSYQIESYERPSVAADIALFTIREEGENSYRHDPIQHLSLLLIKRGEHPFQGCWALPGGFLRRNETMEECAHRETLEETGIAPQSLYPIGIFSEPDRDPRGWILSGAYLALSNGGIVPVRSSADAAEARWFDVELEQNNDELLLKLTSDDLTLCCRLQETNSSIGGIQYRITGAGELAFDHGAIIASALRILQNEAAHYRLLFDFLPETFTLSALQRVQETITKHHDQPANFRRKIADYVIETDEITTGAGHRPAKRYRRA